MRLGYDTSPIPTWDIYSLLELSKNDFKSCVVCERQKLSGISDSRVIPVWGSAYCKSHSRYHKPIQPPLAVVSHNKRIQVYHNGKYLSRTHLIASYIYGKRPEGFVVHHIDRDGQNDHPDNLIYLTASGHNFLHRHLHKRIPRDRDALLAIDRFFMQAEFKAIEFLNQ